MMISNSVELLINNVYTKILVLFIFVNGVMYAYSGLDETQLIYENFVANVESSTYLYYIFIPLFMISVVDISKRYYREWVFVRFSKNGSWLKEKNTIVFIYTAVLVVCQKAFNALEYCYTKRSILDIEEFVDFISQMFSAIVILYTIWLIVDICFGVIQSTSAVYVAYVIVIILTVTIFRECKLNELYVQMYGYLGCIIVILFFLAVNTISKIYWKKKSIIIKKKG